MGLYLTGLLIDCSAVMAVGSYYLYYVIKKKEPEEPRHYFWIVMTSISLVVIASLYYIYTGDLTTATILAWVMAVPVVITAIFILLIIIFRPNWN
jgi:presenilin-like A22 family membrane protease